MSRYCECGRKVFTPKGRGLRDKNHDLCKKCYRSHRDSSKSRPARTGGK